jgi:hypothetical protein
VSLKFSLRNKRNRIFEKYKNKKETRKKEKEIHVPFFLMTLQS